MNEWRHPEKRCSRRRASPPPLYSRATFLVSLCRARRQPLLLCPATRKERKGKIEIPSGRDFSAERKQGEGVLGFALSLFK
jgi:hypothetical protein